MKDFRYLLEYLLDAPAFQVVIEQILGWITADRTRAGPKEAERTRTGSKGHAPQLPCPSKACRRAWAPG